MEIKALSNQKIEQAKDLTIRPTFPFYSRSKNLQTHVDKMREVLLSYLTDPLPFKDKESLGQWIKDSIPWITWSSFESPPDSVTLFFLIKPLNSLPTETFISEMIKRWLLPHQETTILSFEHMEFYFDHYPKEALFLGEVKVLIQNKKEANLLKENLPLLKREIISALSARRYAKSLLETKILPLDHKMNLIRESFIKLIHRFPDELDEILFERLAFMQAYASKEFREERSYIHLGKIILSFVLIRNHLRRELNAFPEKRHMKIRFMPTELSFPFGKKPVLGLSIGLNLFHQYEFFNEKHVLRAVQKFIPNVRIVAGSTYRANLLNDPIATLYVELEKNDGKPLTLDERMLLRRNLEEELKKRIEHLVPSLFMVRNEEETMRNILILSRELKSPDDLPQMMITFDQHSQDDLVFTVVLLRVKKEGMPPLQDLMKNVDPRIRFILDRVQIVNFLEKTHPIEANVFRLQIAKLPSFLRMDFSVNLYLAREEVVAFLNKHLGEIRDYNGGMMIKQGELLTQFKRLFQDISVRNQELLENFFYSLNPIESQATISLQSLSFFFELFVKMTEKEYSNTQSYLMQMDKDEDITIAITRANDPDFRSSVEEALSETQIQDRSLVSSVLTFEGSYYLSYLYEEPDKKKQKLFEETLTQTLEKWQADKNKLQILRVPYTDIVSLDPRIGGDQDSSILVKLLFDGLMRINDKGIPECAIAETYEVSRDKKTYTFYLRDTKWSNGDSVTAYDFEYAWKKILSPGFMTPFAYVFYPIKNARRAKEGKSRIDEVGILVVDEKTLVVELENPAPYFLELTTNTMYSPVNHRIDKLHPNWSSQKDEHFVCNGPFKQGNPTRNHVYEFQKNLSYWNKESIHIDQIHLSQLKVDIAVQMFNSGQLDCIGSSMCPAGNINVKELKESLSHYHSLRIFWQCFNLNHFPFNQLKVRQAFSMAINRQEILQWHIGERLAAYTPLPYQLSQCKESPFLIREDEKKAKELFAEALDELGMKIDDFPIIYISITNIDKKSAETLKNQLERVLGVKCVIEAAEWSSHFKKMTTRNYQLGGIYWASWLNDPIYTLQSFKDVKEKVNFTGWENKSFQNLLDQSDHTTDIDKRNEFLREAEELLIKEAVVIPIFYCAGWFIKHSNLVLNSFTSNGNIDFSKAYFK
ncbi:MAG: peptide ABC transporter substrate-binding protein [Chlamydiia bacterium]|nr:peptide ABC transporter substrate-binding protein [Chlamydiia bacterium]